LKIGINFFPLFLSSDQRL